MSVTFANVSAVNIPQGEVVKIIETSGGRVLWQKKVSMAGYPRMRIKIKKADGEVLYTNWRDEKGIIYSSGEDGYLNCLWNVNKEYFISVDGVPVDNVVTVGDTYTAYYLDAPWASESEVSDTVWTFSSMWLTACSTLTWGVGPALIDDSSTLIKLSSYKGASVKVRSADTKQNGYAKDFENAYKARGIDAPDKSERPMLRFDFTLKAESPSLKLHAPLLEYLGGRPRV